MTMILTPGYRFNNEHASSLPDKHVPHILFLSHALLIPYMANKVKIESYVTHPLNDLIYYLMNIFEVNAQIFNRSK